MGNSHRYRDQLQGLSVHPHVRGEQKRHTAVDSLISGSSPRAWGTVIEDEQVFEIKRFIPTCVGNRAYAGVSGFSISVHPHVRGEQAGQVDPDVRAAGSSPRAWGTARRAPLGDGRIRFIPTCVGNSPSPGPSGAAGTVHPHVRGEQDCLEPLTQAWTGSSPRAWGTVHTGSAQLLRRRFIPTCVGNSLDGQIPIGFFPVHPHVRGEQLKTLAVTSPRTGSSPRAWGTGMPFRGRAVPPPVHPHVRGEQVTHGANGWHPHGSSPRAWGTGRNGGVIPLSGRFIPTCVGNREARRNLRAKAVRFIPTCVGNR